ncbi:MAG TPA: hypothetical protein VFQ27_06570 [Xanthobacteraceae bacterium]|nr:hypothetical protein [Xanthobacteraceae bacterium]
MRGRMIARGATATAASRANTEISLISLQWGHMFAKLKAAIALALATTLAGCTACDFPLYVPQSCRSAPAPQQPAHPPGR